VRPPTGPRLRVGIDATPLLGRQTGIGVYTRNLLNALAAGSELSIVATAFSSTGTSGLAGRLPDGVTAHGRRIPARLLQRSWLSARQPPVEFLCGGVDVFHATNFVLPPLRAARGVVSVHDLSFLRYPQFATRDTARYATLVPVSVRRARAVCALTAAMADEIAEQYRVERDDVRVVPPGIDDDWFEAKPLAEAALAGLGLPPRFLVAVGTLEPRKNLPMLIEAFRRLRGQDERTPPLVLVGPPGWGPRLDLGGLPAGSVVTTGYLDAATLRSVVASSCGLAFPSVYEGFGLPPLEALACGVPAVASDLAVTREVLGTAATLVPGDDPDALCEALRAAVADDRDTVDGRERALRRREHARQWTWQRTAESALAAYRHALG